MPDECVVLTNQETFTHSKAAGKHLHGCKTRFLYPNISLNESTPLLTISRCRGLPMQFKVEVTNPTRGDNWTYVLVLG